MSKETIKLFFMNKDKKLSYLKNKKIKLLETKSYMINNMNSCEKFFSGELEGTFYENTSNFTVFKHLYRNSTKKFNETLLELEKLNRLINKLT